MQVLCDRMMSSEGMRAAQALRPGAFDANQPAIARDCGGVRSVAKAFPVMPFHLHDFGLSVSVRDEPRRLKSVHQIAAESRTPQHRAVEANGGKNAPNLITASRDVARARRGWISACHRGMTVPGRYLHTTTPNQSEMGVQAGTAKKCLLDPFGLTASEPDEILISPDQRLRQYFCRGDAV